MKKPEFLYHGSSKLVDILLPNQAHDGLHEEGCQYAVYATSVRNVALTHALGKVPDETGRCERFMYKKHPSDPEQVAFLHGHPNFGGKGYLYKMSSEGFTHAVGRQWVCPNPVKPIEILEINVDDYLHLFRYATDVDRQELEQLHNEVAKRSEVGSIEQGRMEMEQLCLVKPTVALKTEYLDMLEDWRRSGEKLVPWVLNFDPSDFPVMIEMLEGYSKGVGLKEDQVEHSTYWLVNEERKVLGAVNIRHRLNDYLLKKGGHIGYGIRPSERKKGYAKEMLRLALEVTKTMGLERVLVTCDKENTGSARTIIYNGGILESEEIENGIPFQRYWIKIS